jgi:hypothetical protein
MISSRNRVSNGFALIIVLALLSLVVLITVGLAILTRTNTSIANASESRVSARQNALLGLGIAIGELQARAGRDDVLTGMAGLTSGAGVGAGAGNSARHWAGVWDSERRFVAWIVSGANGNTVPDLRDGVTLVSTASLGADATDREHVRVLRVPTSSLDPNAVTDGGYAYWAGDEGVKLSCSLPDDVAVISGARHAINQQFTNVAPASLALDSLITFEQMNLVGATTAQRQGAFHSYGVTHLVFSNNSLVGGLLNVNSTSVRYWTGVGATFMRFDMSGAGSMTAAQFGSDAAALAGRPFRTVEEFLSAIAPRLTARGASPAAFNATMRPWLTVRSETFRIRAYGDAVGSVAYCEAIVQRTPEMMPDGSGRRIVITYFRWLTPSDI